MNRDQLWHVLLNVTWTHFWRQCEIRWTQTNISRVELITTQSRGHSIKTHSWIWFSKVDADLQFERVKKQLNEREKKQLETKSMPCVIYRRENAVWKFFNSGNYYFLAILIPSCVSLIIQSIFIFHYLILQFWFLLNPDPNGRVWPQVSWSVSHSWEACAGHWMFKSHCSSVGNESSILGIRLHPVADRKDHSFPAVSQRETEQNLTTHEIIQFIQVNLLDDFCTIIIHYCNLLVYIPFQLFYTVFYVVLIPLQFEIYFVMPVVQRTSLRRATHLHSTNSANEPPFRLSFARSASHKRFLMHRFLNVRSNTMFFPMASANRRANLTHAGTQTEGVPATRCICTSKKPNDATALWFYESHASL